MRMLILAGLASEQKNSQTDCRDTKECEESRPFTQEKDSHRRGEDRSTAASDWIDQRDVTYPVAALQKEIVADVDDSAAGDEEPVCGSKRNFIPPDRPNNPRSENAGLEDINAPKKRETSLDAFQENVP
jgi:hypothetical protein